MKKTGPGMLIAAAFIGPGTVTTCIRAGVDLGYTLLWALVLSVVATIVLQEMAGRLGLVTRKGLPVLIRSMLPVAWIRMALVGLILAAIILGNAAYEAGNLAGAVLGMEAVFGRAGVFFYPYGIGVIAGALLWSGSYKLLERAFTALVLLMSLSFLLTAVLVGPDIGAILKGMFLPSFGDGGLLTVMALIGTTVVPYNLFLYTSLVQEKWTGGKALSDMRKDIVLSVLVGGAVSMAILITAAGSGIQAVRGVGDLATALEPVYGPAARYGLGVGLLAAGITSAITAPLAAAYVARQCFDWVPDQSNWKFRAVWLGVLISGVLSLSLDFRPLEVIFFAQVANAILLPLIAALLWWMAGSGRLLGADKNGPLGQFMAVLVLLLVTGLAVRSLISVFG